MNAGAILAIVLAAALPAVAAAAAADEEEPHPYYSFVPGRFAVIGQLPDGGAAYQGQARIAHVEGRLQLLKEIGGESVTAEGTVERADPGEADVIRFRGKDFEQTCLVRLDLDNYARLSCLW
ncbi:MAG TPA: hypothetical protein VJM11_18025, partial [Nevskiaceae bacterium]|nr:hypothetical protein [Nevskiaceae bacterium]